ncbi:MAG: hydrogenase maturation nickel metallochaperone HypA [Thiogranum sp.]
MHELSICQALIDQVEALAREQRAKRVLSLVVGVGPLSGVEARLLKQAYPVAAAGTLAEGSELDIEDRPIRVHCKSCGEDSDATANRLVCAFCEDWRTDLISGDELVLTRVEFVREQAYV